jgi:hypothetical protein
VTVTVALGVADALVVAVVFAAVVFAATEVVV